MLIEQSPNTIFPSAPETIPPVQKESTADFIIRFQQEKELHLATEIQLFCDQIESEEFEESNEDINKVAFLISQLPGTEHHKSRLTATLSSGNTPREGFLHFQDELNIDLNKNQRGLCSYEQTKRYETKQLKKNMPQEFSEAMSQHRGPEAMQILREMGQWETEYEAYYGEKI